MKHTNFLGGIRHSIAAVAIAFLATLPFASLATAAPGSVTVTVKSPTATGPEIGVGFRWILEEDRTYHAAPGTPLSETQATNMYRTYMPVAGYGHSEDATVTIETPDDSKHYVISVLPDQSLAASPGDAIDCQVGGCYTMSGKQILPGQTSVTVVVSPQPVPTAQVFVRAFEDTSPINNVWDDTEAGLGGFVVFIYDVAGQMNTDTFGNPLGTVYNGLNADGTPHVQRLGDGTLHTMTAAEQGDPLKNPYGLEVGEALIKNLAPGKYGVRIVPPSGQGWQLTSTIEGTPGQDVWVKAGEPRFFAEFGPAGHHAEYGFVKDAKHPTAAGHYPAHSGPGVISGTIRNQRMTRPSDVAESLGFSSGHKLAGCWVGLNNSAGVGIYAGPCDDDSGFSITGLPPGTYQLVVFDQYLDLIFNAVSIDVGVNGQPNERTGIDVPTFRWFQAHEHWVFFDENENGQRDPGEVGIPDQTINLRYRDGSIYQTSTTDTAGYLPFDEVFPFFSWLVAEVDFARFKATGVTIATDAGGPVKGTETGGEVPSIDRIGNVGHGHLNPQPQDPNPLDPTEAGRGTNLDPITGIYQTRTECSNTSVDGCAAPGPVLVEGYNAFLGTTNVFEWGKKPYSVGENGGITGVVYYQVTRAENDPRFAAPETWEVGIPRVPLALYRSNSSGVIYKKNVDGSQGVLSTPASLVLADADFYPFCWTDPDSANDLALCPNGAVPEDGKDIDRNLDDVFDLGDAIEVAHTDSWDDNVPENCPGSPLDSFHMPVSGGATPFNGRCYDGLRNFNQVRPAVFDGGYAFGAPFTDLPLTAGHYVVQAFPPSGYKIQREQDKNVDFGDAMTLSPQGLPPICVGDPNLVPAQLDLFPGVDSKFAGQSRPLCDRKVADVADGKNAAADFFMFTDVPVTGHIQGFVLNDLANEFDPLSPNFGEKFAPSFIPVSVRDYAGNEVYHTTTDAYGTYNAIVPSAFRINTPMPSGVSPNMLQVCLNAPMMADPVSGQMVPDPNFNKKYTQFCYTLNFVPGQTTFLDTPVLPIASYTGPGSPECDCEYPDGTPVIHSVVSDQHNGPVVRPTGGTLTLTSEGHKNVPDPNVPATDGNNANTVDRDYGFGSSGTVTLNGVVLATTAWDEDAITVTVPANSNTGQLVVTRTDAGKPPVKSVHSITVIVAEDARVHEVAIGGSIQAVIDAATTRPGDVVLVPTGNYQEMLVMTKPVQLQGAGAGSTIINPLQSPTEKIGEWRKKVNYLANCSHQLGLLVNQPNNVASSSGPCGFTPGTGLFSGSEGPGVLVAPIANAFNSAPARVDGFTITGADQSAGILVNGNARLLEISNNVISNNQGGAAAGIRVGHPTLLDANDELVDANNDNLNIHNNHVQQNGGLFEPGAGIGLYNGSDNYRVTSNYICGNFAQGDGGGIAHYGRSPGGLIADNKILFNQTFDQTAGAGGSGGGILIAGHEPQAGAAVPLSAGSGSVQILRNLIQGNNAGSGDGGGIALRFVNGQEVETVGIGGATTTPASIRSSFDAVQILNNMIVNNVTGLAGGGLSMLDAVNVAVINNTIANNDSTATAAAALTTSGNASLGPQPAGIVSRGHSAALLAAAAARIGGSNDRLEQAVGRYSDAKLQNDIILGNRAMVWLSDGSFPATGQIFGGIIDASPLRFYDLAVVGVSPAATLSPTSSMLTLAAETIAGQPACGVGGNICKSGELATELTVLQCPYRHGETTPGTPGCSDPATSVGGSHMPGGEFPILAAAALDEGGNFIDVHFGPLTERAGNYHLASCTSTDPLPVPVGPAPTVRSATSYSSTGDAILHQVPWPAGMQTGDRVVFVVVSDGNPNNLSAGFLQGFTIVPFTAVGSAVNAGGAVSARVYQYDVGASVPSGNFGVLMTSPAFVGERIQVRTFVISGHDAGVPVQVAVNSNGTGSNSMVYPTLTPPGAWGAGPKLWIQTAGFDGGSGHAFVDATSPAGYTNTYTVQASTAGVGVTSGYASSAAASELPGPVGFTGTADQWVSITIGVKAAVVTGGGGTGDCAVDGGTVPNAGQFPNRSPDVDGDFRPYGANFDIGADEYTVGVSPNTTVGGNANVAPQIVSPANGASLPAFTGVPLSLPVIATDLNGDLLSYSLCVGLGCTTPGSGLPPGLGVSSVTGVISWASPTGSVSNVRLTVSDGVLSVTNTFSIAASSAGAATANNDPGTPVAYNVNTNGVFTVAAPGVLVNDTPANATAVLDQNLSTAGSVSLASDGSFVFTPKLGWVGTDSFTYFAVNAAGVPSALPGTVTVSRQVAATDASFRNGVWTLQGVQVNPAQTLVFRRARTANCSTNANCPEIAGTATLGEDGTWSFTSSGGAPSWQPGDTVRVFGSTAFDSLLLQDVAVSSIDTRTAPNSTAFVQCPGDTNGDGVSDTTGIVCKHLGAGDGFIKLADGKDLYTFGFSDLTGVPANLAIDKGILNAQFPAPTLKFKEGDQVYLTLTNVGMLKRPDLFDPHSVHFHGFPNAGAVFDGVPESSISINMGFSLTYYYKIMEPGTFMYHCHVEASEHMQMGMLGNLYVEPAQNGTSKTYGGKTYTNFVYNDGDGATGYDTGTVNGVANQPLEFPIQIGSMDSNFHIEHLGVQPLPFAEMHDDYPMLNGRGYPDTVNVNGLPAAAEKEESGVTSATDSSQVVHTRIEAQVGKKMLLRISNLNVTRFYTLATTGGLRMKVVGTGAHILRGPGGADLSYESNSVTLGGGESADVLIDTTGVAPGTYLLYSTNLEALSNGAQDLGGMMTEIVIN